MIPMRCCVQKLHIACLSIAQFVTVSNRLYSPAVRAYLTFGRMSPDKRAGATTSRSGLSISFLVVY